MSGFEAVFDEIAKNAIEKNRSPNDTWNAEGILVCGVCGQPKTQWMLLGEHRSMIPKDCECVKEKRAAEKALEEEEKQVRFLDSIRKKSNIPQKYQNALFANAKRDEENRKNVTLCKSYLKRFPLMEQKNQGLLLYGDKGTGKTYYASCIGNGVLETGKSVLFLSLPKLLQEHRNFRDDSAEEALLGRVEKVKLLIIDDFGAERGTDYALEFVYSVIDRRYCAEKPMIVTTNLVLSEVRESLDIRYGRIIDRIFEVCFPLEFRGRSKRIAEAEERFESMKQLLEG